MRRTNCGIAVLMATLIGCCVSAHAQNYTYTTLSDPLAVKGTWATGIFGNNVVGYYNDANNVSHGFLYNGSTYTTIDDPLAANVPEPGGSGTRVTGISGNNIAGYYMDAGEGFHGFLYNGSTYTTLTDPLDAGGTTKAFGVSGNNVVGIYITKSDQTQGFLYNGSNYTSLTNPIADTNQGTIVEGIDGTNIVGFYVDLLGRNEGFVYNGSSYSTLDYPAAAETILYGISGNSVVGTEYGSTAGAPAGFVFNGSTYTLLDPSGTSPNYIPAGISGSTIVGAYNANNTSYGFIATAVPEPASISLLILGCAGMLLRVRRSPV